MDVLKLEKLNRKALRGLRIELYALAIALVLSVALNIWQAL